MGKPVLRESHKSMIGGIVGPAIASRFFEYIDSNHLITAKELLLGEFDSNCLSLRSYKTPEFAAINDDVFAFLEEGKFNNGDKAVISRNLNNYFAFLEMNKLREAMAHFANMFSGTKYPNSLVFIINECPELYAQMTMFVAEIK